MFTAQKPSLIFTAQLWFHIWKGVQVTLSRGWPRPGCSPSPFFPAIISLISLLFDKIVLSSLFLCSGCYLYSEIWLGSLQCSCSCEKTNEWAPRNNEEKKYEIKYFCQIRQSWWWPCLRDKYSREECSYYAVSCIQPEGSGKPKRRLHLLTIAKVSLHSANWAKSDLWHGAPEDGDNLPGLWRFWRQWSRQWRQNKL